MMKKIFLLSISLACIFTIKVDAQWSASPLNSTVNAAVTLSNEQGQGINIGVSSCYGCYSTVAKPGDVVLRTNGGGDLMLGMKSSAGNGVNRKVKIVSDDYYYSHFQVWSTGQTIIGNIPDWKINNNYGLFVEKGILTERVKVALTSSNDWADYVFDKKYKLMPLSKVEQFIIQHKHLPNVPSADEVVKEGIDMAKMDAKLLEKIEELTLYVIKLNKEVEALKRLNNSVSK